jgi:hypothetical protein
MPFLLQSIQAAIDYLNKAKRMKGLNDAVNPKGGYAR